MLEIAGRSQPILVHLDGQRPHQAQTARGVGKVVHGMGPTFQYRGRDRISLRDYGVRARVQRRSRCRKGRTRWSNCEVRSLPGDAWRLPELCWAKEHLSILDRERRGDRGLAIRSGLRQYRQR
jgi:hypothetical protein